MTGPLISFVIPAYNVAPWLARCVGSILAEAGVEVEVLLVDDGSTDDTPGICDDLARGDPRVRAIHQENGNVSAARNTGLDAARGEYVWFVDGDDGVAPGSLPLLEGLLERETPDLIRFGFRKCFPDGKKELWCFPDRPGLYTGDGLQKLRLDAICYPHVLDYTQPRMLSACAMLCRRAFLLENHLRFSSEREVLNEDYLFVMQAMHFARSVRICAEPLYQYLLRSGSLSTSPRPDMYRRKRRLFEIYRQTLGAEGGETAVRLRNFYIDCIYNCFVEVCSHAPDARQAVAQIRPLLADPELQRCLKENRSRIRSVKTRCICFLMRRQLAGPMYRPYKLCK